MSTRLDIGNVSDLDRIHVVRLQHALCEAFAPVFAAMWIGFDLAQSSEQGRLAAHEQRLADCAEAWIFTQEAAFVRRSAIVLASFQFNSA